LGSVLKLGKRWLDARMDSGSGYSEGERKKKPLVEVVERCGKLG